MISRGPPHADAPRAAQSSPAALDDFVSTKDPNEKVTDTQGGMTDGATAGSAQLEVASAVHRTHARTASMRALRLAAAPGSCARTRANVLTVQVHSLGRGGAASDRSTLHS